MHGAHLSDAEVAQRHGREALGAGADRRRATHHALQLVAGQCVHDHLQRRQSDQGCSPKKRSGGRLKQDLDKDF